MEIYSCEEQREMDKQKTKKKLVLVSHSLKENNNSQVHFIGIAQNTGSNARN